MKLSHYWNDLFDKNIKYFAQNPYFGVYKVKIDEKARILLPSQLRNIKQDRDDLISQVHSGYKKNNFYLYSKENMDILFLSDVNNQSQICLKNLKLDNTCRLSLGKEIKNYFEVFCSNDDELEKSKSSIYLIGDENYIFLGKLNGIKKVFPSLEKILLSL